MQTVNFNCPFCGKLMAVGINLLGRNVRCPHCKQVVQAPAAAGPAKPAPFPPTRPEPSLQLPAKPTECHESIFGEVHDDDLFGTKQPTVQMPVDAPAPIQPTARTVPQLAAFDTATVEMNAGPEVPNPFALASAATVSMEPTRNDAATSDPWAASLSPSQQYATPAPSQARAAEPNFTSYPSRRAAEESRGGGSLVWILLLYSAIATAGAGYLYYLHFVAGGERVPQVAESKPHPFTTIPDFFGQYDKTDRKKPAKIEGMPPVTLDLPKELEVPLGETLSIGALEVKPIKVEYRTIARFVKEPGGNLEMKESSLPIYLLRVHIKNTSDDLVLNPTDPAFNCLFFQSAKVTPYTAIVIGSERFPGGPFYWPDPQFERQYMEGQESDAKPLGPKEERDYLFYSPTDTRDIKRAIEKGTAGGKELPITWRVQLRSGLVPCKDDFGKEWDVSVTGVIGVAFRASDIR